MLWEALLKHCRIKHRLLSTGSYLTLKCTLYNAPAIFFSRFIMHQFTVGQRWVSAGELHLGIGMVIEVDFRTVTIIFPATGETRVYAKQIAPLSRVEFASGDQINDQEGRNLVVQEVPAHVGVAAHAHRLPQR